MQPRPERQETDNSLLKEREKADLELTKQRSTAEQTADQVLELARERADRVLDEQREQADARLQEAGAPTGVAEALSVDRASEDEGVDEARVAADDKVEAERDEKNLEHLESLEVEREETDERLHSERVHSDRSVSSRDEFLAVVSHELRGILAGMALSANVLMATPPEKMSAKRIHQEADRIHRSCLLMNRLIGDLVDVASMELGQLKLNASQQDARQLLTEVIEISRLNAAEREIAMTCELPKSQVLANFDHDRIFQVLMNLVGNALKFTAAGGQVALHLAPTKTELQFTVRDSGSGIAEDHLELIFERFSQQVPSDGNGMGLGLYIARCIIVAHGGKIWAESELGKGSTFHFTLPAGRSQASSTLG